MKIYLQKIACIATLVVLGTMLLAGCGGGSAPAAGGGAAAGGGGAGGGGGGAAAPAGGGTEAASPGEPRILTMWSWALGNYALAFDAFFDAHDVDYILDDITVAADDYITRLQTTFAAGGDMPDILLAEIGWRAVSFRLGIWENLEAAPYNLDRSLLMDFAIGINTGPGGYIVGLENGLNPVAIAYKRDLMLEWFGTDSREELEAIFQTADDFITVGRDLYERSGGTMTLFAGPQDITNMMLNQQRHISNVDTDGNIYISSKIRPILGALEEKRAANVFGNLTMWSSAWAANHNESSSVLFPVPPWGVPAILVPNDPHGDGNWGMFTPPGGSFGWGGTSYGIFNGSDMKDEAWEFLSWVFLSHEGADAVKRYVGVFLPVLSLFEDPEYTRGTHRFFGEQQIYEFMMEELAPTIPMAALSIYDSMITDSLNMIAEVMLVDHSVTAEEAFDRFMQDLQLRVPDTLVR